MLDLIGNRVVRLSFTAILRLLLTVSIAIVLPIAGCKQQSAAPAGPRTFASPEEAANALADAAKSQNRDKILQIFGPGSADILSSGDATEDQTSLKGFAQAYQAMNRWRKLSDGSELLVVGTDNQVFPMPLMKNASGQWYFDASAGKEEILARRIGQDEIAATNVCAAVADAQAQYFSQKYDGVNQYAQKFISDTGQQNGLYWQSPQGSQRSPLGPLVAYATAEGYKVQPNQHQPFHGYYFAVLKKQGPDAKGGAKDYIVDGKMTQGFAVLAYPAQYGDSGIMTFIINQDGTLFQKDLGSTTNEVAAAMTTFDPDPTWKVVD
jgi:Protein of unknown function (DUF2950)